MDAATLTIPQACAVLGISERTGYELARRDEFPVQVIRLGRCRRVSKRALAEFIDGPYPAPSPSDEGAEK